MIGSCSCAWDVKSRISFNYRVVEVPQGSLLDPANDALVFGHLSPGSAERTAAMARQQRRLVVIDEKVYRLYGSKVEDYFLARGVDLMMLPLPLNEDNKSMDMALKICKTMKDWKIDR